MAASSFGVEVEIEVQPAVEAFVIVWPVFSDSLQNIELIQLAGSLLKMATLLTDCPQQNVILEADDHIGMEIGVLEYVAAFRSSGGRRVYPGVSLIGMNQGFPEIEETFDILDAKRHSVPPHKTVASGNHLQLFRGCQCCGRFRSHRHRKTVKMQDFLCAVSDIHHVHFQEYDAIRNS
jgi:hypothetical protein